MSILHVRVMRLDESPSGFFVLVLARSSKSNSAAGVYSSLKNSRSNGNYLVKTISTVAPTPSRRI